MGWQHFVVKQTYYVVKILVFYASDKNSSKSSKLTSISVADFGG